MGDAGSERRRQARPDPPILLEIPAYVRYKGMHGRQCLLRRGRREPSTGASSPGGPGQSGFVVLNSSSSASRCSPHRARQSKGPRMAFRFSRIAILACAAITVAGCASPAVMDSLPEPNFNGPVVAAPPPPPVAQPKFTTPELNKPQPPVASGRMTGPRDWTPTVAPRAWKWIVIHHSATPTGSAAMFDKMHKANGWDELGYHFVIGNGTNSGNGQVEVGGRWRAQKWGAHAKTADNRYNDYGIGICLVGNFDVDRPTPAQQQSLAKLVAFLEKTYRVPGDRVIGHGETKATDCPGRFMNIAQVRSQARAMLVEAGEPTAPVAVTAGGELLTDAK